MGPVDGRFVLERALGSGAMGEAHLGRDRDGSLVVVKLLHRKLAADPVHLERFRREVRALEKLRHPNIVSLRAYGLCRERQQPYFAMDCSQGASLDAVIHKDAPFPLERALRVMDQILSALAFAHSQGVVHRDLKPANILLEAPGTPGEHVRLLDFGIAKHLQGGERTVQELTGNQSVGTPVYMAPEQWEGQPVEPRTDVYAVGCLLMELLTGEPPFPRAAPMRVLIVKHTTSKPPRVDERRDDLPKAVSEAVASCLRKIAAERPEAAALQIQLRKLIT